MHVLLLRHGASRSVIEVITNHREPQSLEAVYILMPTTENIRRIIRDFTPGNEMYSAAHLFFTDRTYPWNYMSNSKQVTNLCKQQYQTNCFHNSEAPQRKGI